MRRFETPTTMPDHPMQVWQRGLCIELRGRTR